MATAARQQPPWQQPSASPDANLPPLKIFNSLTRSKTPFVPIDWKNRNVTWYSCGPTVYDDAHLGHCRNYTTSDIIRRLLRDYFKFNVRYVQNVTDIDDKIIVRGRQRHLLDLYNRGQLQAAEDVSGARLAALEAYVAKNLSRISEKTLPSDIKAESEKQYSVVLNGGPLDDDGVPGDKEAKIKLHIKTVHGALVAIKSFEANVEPEPEALNDIEDVLMPYLDSLYGSTIDARNHGIFTKLTREYENRFTEDMQALNCLDPDEVTRVTEYGPQIVDFVRTIQNNQFAYQVGQSVYFDIKAFESANNTYARLEPWSRNDTQRQAEGEGALTGEQKAKRSPSDFVLWKSSKPGEPSWPSPWGNGRPGWHIECSAMCSDKLGSQADIHSGGIDLAFPHHDNEIAQSEAYWFDKGINDQRQWINYFLHMGHLSISGSKMSKSLKNFTTIRQALSSKEWTPRSLRIIFLQFGWKDGIEVTPAVKAEGSAWEEKVNNFFIKANDLPKDSPHANGSTANNSLIEELEKAKEDTYTALCDSFSTPEVMGIISRLITKHNSEEKSEVTPATTLSIARWVTSMVNIFGLNGRTSAEDTKIGWSGIDVPEDAKPILTVLSRKRDTLRRQARSSEGVTKQDLSPLPEQGGQPFDDVIHNFNGDLKSLEESTSLSKDILRLCDRLRDVDLWERGIYLEDRDGDQPALIRPVTKELKAAKDEKEAREQQKQKAREEREREAAAKAAEKSEKGRLSHRAMFRTEEFSAWDDEGLPTKDREGEEITKSRRKKLQKDWERQKKLHEAWLSSNVA